MTDWQVWRDTRDAPWLTVLFVAMCAVVLAALVARLRRRPLPGWLDRIWLTLIALSAVLWLLIWAQRLLS